MGPAVLPALEALGAAALVLAIFRLSPRFPLIRKLRFALSIAALLLAVLLAERQLHHPGREAASTAALAVLVLVAVHVFLQLADHVVWERFLKPRHISVPRLLFDVVNFLVLAGVGLALLKILYSVNLTGLLVTSTVLSAILGLSLQDVLTSVMAGIALQIESPIEVRDWIRVGDKEGEIVQMNWRSITLRAREGHHVVVPNARMAKEDILNYSRPSPLEMLHVAVGVAYDHPPAEVKAVIEAAVDGADGVVSTPPVQVLVARFADSAIEYDVRLWIRDFARVPFVRDAVHARIWYALRRAGFGIPFPQREVAVRQVSEGHDEERAERLRRENVEVLRAVETFRPLSDEQVAALSRSARMERYTAGELLVRQGDEGRSLFVIKSGEVRIEKSGPDGRSREVARLGPGRFFGEMSLLTGEPRTASVLACSELEVTVVDKAAFAALIQTDQRLARALSEELETRSREAALVAAARSQEEPVGPLVDSRTLFTRIQRFFGIDG